MTDINNKDSWHWKPSLSVGVVAIDEDHKRLFQLFYEAHLLSEKDNNSSLLYQLAQELVLYTQSHFKREEAIMQASAYPFCENHFAIHISMIKQLQQTLQLAISGNESVTDFIVFLKDWFIEHIKESDHRIKRYVNGFEQEIEQALLAAGPLALADNVSIYVVDDEEQQVEMMLEIIDISGLSAKGFTLAAEFINQKISNDDIVLLDLNMPNMDGIEVMRKLYDKNCSPTYILMSGFDERVLHSAKQFAVSKGIVVAETLTKPIDTRYFIQHINELYSEKKLTFDKRISQQTIQKLPSDKQVLLLDDLKFAINNHNLVLFYQPQIELQTGKIHGFEALVRLQHPVMGLVFPDQFIEMGEQNGLISEITNEVIDLAIRDYSVFCDLGISAKISINISAKDLLDLSMPEKLALKLEANNIPPEAIMVELTESAVLSSVSDSLDILNRLRMKGFSLSIDDFGTGHSSLVQLYQAPFTELKIDQHFTMKMMSDDEAMSIVKICILLAKELKMETVAEGVETQEIWDKLKDLGCDVAQGYLISKPLALSACCEWVAKYKQ